MKRLFLGWLRGEPRHCSMAQIPTLEEDARRPNRERENLVSERTRIINRMKSTLARLGIRGFKPTLRKAPEQLARLRTPEGALLPPSTLAELQRDMARLRFIIEQIREIEAARLARLEQHPEQANHPMILLLARIIGVGIETADMLVGSRPGAIPWRDPVVLCSDLVVAFLELVYLALSLFARNSIALLNSSDELVTLAFDDLPVIIGKLAPFFFRLSDQLLPVSLILIGIHRKPQAVGYNLPTILIHFRFPQSRRCRTLLRIATERRGHSDSRNLFRIWGASTEIGVNGS